MNGKNDTTPKPWRQDVLSTTTIHQIYYACYGNPQGIPALFVHGGPGGGTDPSNTEFFDLEHFNVVLVDQRGCGNSTPLGHLDANTTQDLIADFEAIRTQLGIKEWLLFGGSWGSTLSLAYAQAHPEVVTHLVLRGIFLGHQHGTDWICGLGGASRVWPEHWHKLRDAFPLIEEVTDPVAYLYQQVTQEDRQLRNMACAAFARWEGAISKHRHDPALAAAFASWPLSYSIARLELHYMQHQFFLEPDQLLSQCQKIMQIPLAIVHGRFDLICPIDDAFALYHTIKQLQEKNHHTTSNITLSIIDNAGHSASEPGIKAELQRLTANIANNHCS